MTEFFNAGHDVLLALAPGASAQLRALAQDLGGVTAAPSGTAVIDHFHFSAPVDDGAHTAVLADALAPLPAVFSAGTTGPVLFRGVALTIPRDSEVAFPALSAAATAYNAKPGGEAVPGGGAAGGGALALVALVQGRSNNARAAISGSVDLLSDAFIAANKPNAGFVGDVARWAFSERGVLRASALRHRVGGELSPALYRINDEVVVELDIEECTSGQCNPFRLARPIHHPPQSALPGARLAWPGLAWPICSPVRRIRNYSRRFSDRLTEPRAGAIFFAALQG